MVVRVWQTHDWSMLWSWDGADAFLYGLLAVPRIDAGSREILIHLPNDPNSYHIYDMTTFNKSNDVKVRILRADLALETVAWALAKIMFETG